MFQKVILTIKFGEALKSFSKALFSTLKDYIWSSTFFGSLQIYSNILWIISTLGMIKPSKNSTLQHI